MKYKLTAKDFKYFKKRVYFWQDILGASHVKIYVFFKKNANEHNCASYERWTDAGTIKIELNTNWKGTKTKKELDDAAFHEVFEAVYLSGLRGLAKGTYSDFEVDQFTHQAVMMACNTIFKAMRKKGA